MLILMMGCISFINVGISFTELVICCLHVNNIVCKQMLLHGRSLIPISVQSYISVPYLVFGIRLSKLNDNNYIIRKILIRKIK